MDEIISAIASMNYDRASECILKSVESLRGAGCELAAITANTPHVVWDRMKDKYSCREYC